MREPLFLYGGLFINLVVDSLIFLFLFLRICKFSQNMSKTFLLFLPNIYIFFKLIGI